MADRRPYDLTATSVVDLEQLIMLDKLGYSEVKSQTRNDFLHGKVTYTQNDTGGSSASLVYTAREAIQSTIDQDCTFTVSALTGNEGVNWLKIIKGASNIASFYTGGGEVYVPSHQYGKTVLFFRITHYDTTSDDTIIIEPVMTTSQATLTTAKFSGSGFTVSSLDHFKYALQGVMCFFEMEITVEVTGTSQTLNINIADWPILKLSADTYESCNCRAVNGSTDVTQSAIIKETSLVVKLSAAPNVSDSITIKANGSFQIQ